VAHPLAGDAAATALVTVLCLANGLVNVSATETLGEPTPGRAATTAWTLALCLPMALRRTWPRVSFVAVTGAFAGFRLVEVPEPSVSTLVLFIALSGAGLHVAPPWRDRLRWSAVAVLFSVIVVTTVTLDVPDELRYLVPMSTVVGVVFNVAFVVAAWLLAEALRGRRDRLVELEARAGLLEAEREERERRAVADERLRISRELHDVVAHHVSVMGVQAGAARRVLRRDPDLATDALGTIEDSGRKAVDELRRLVGFLRSSDERDTGDSLAPQPGLARVAELVDSARAGGLDVRVRVEGERHDLPGSLDLSAFRVVQEALTNVVKHSGAVSADVTLRYLPDAVELEVVDPGPRRASPGTGHGLLGMRERVVLHGGQLSAGVHGGGYRVRARLPVRQVVT